MKTVLKGISMLGVVAFLGLAITNASAGKGPEYSWDESKNPRGPNQCKSDNECDGARTCSPHGWCQGVARSTPAPLKLDGWYRLKTQLRGAGECLEGNQAASPVKGGAAFMDKCQNVTGQLWQFVPEGKHYRLKTQFQGDKKCLESNQAGSPVKSGAAFMDDCKNVSGQLWEVVAEGAGYRLKSQFRGAGECLEGNQSTSPVKGGAAFMDKCQNVTGQIWQLVK